MKRILVFCLVLVMITAVFTACTDSNGNISDNKDGIVNGTNGNTGTSGNTNGTTNNNGTTNGNGTANGNGTTNGNDSNVSTPSTENIVR